MTVTRKSGIADNSAAQQKLHDGLRRAQPIRPADRRCEKQRVEVRDPADEGSRTRRHDRPYRDEGDQWRGKVGGEDMNPIIA